MLRSVHAADAGKVMNPMQCRGQTEGGIAQALGATLFENVRLNDSGEVTTTAFRQYRLPQHADIPRTEAHFVETSDAIGPLGAKSMSESPFNPVAPAFADALRDATGIRFTELPLTRDRVWLALERRAGTAVGRSPGGLRPRWAGCGRCQRAAGSRAARYEGNPVSRFPEARQGRWMSSHARFRRTAAGHTF